MEGREVVLLSVALQDEKKAQFISKEKISLAYSHITTIDRVPYPYNKITKLHISHNKIVTLDGIEQFQNLEQLSLSYNRIEDLNEFYKVNNRYRVKELSVRGNPLTNHPDYLNFLIEIFPCVFRIDDLVIEPGDRRFLINYERICGLIVPFYISTQRDLEIATSYLNHINELQVSKDQSEGDFTQNTNRREKLLANSQNGIKIIDELKSQLSHPGLLEALNLEQQTDLQLATKIPSEASPLTILQYIVSLINSLYPSFEHIEEEDSNVLYETYKTIFNEIMIQYHGQSDKSLDIFLTNQVLQNLNYDLERFSNDSVYAFECILLEFYKLMPSQAFFTENIVADTKSTDRSKSDTRNSKHDSRKKSPLDIAATDPEYLKTVSLAHFPIFPLNKQYLSNLYTVLSTQAFFLKSTCSEFFETVEKVYGSQNNETDAMTLGSLRADKQGTRTADSQIGFSTRDSAGFKDELGATGSQRLRGSKHQMFESLPEEKSVLPILMFVKLNDKFHALKADSFELMKQSGTAHKMSRLKQIQDFLLVQQTKKQKKHFDALKIAGQVAIQKGEAFYKKNLYLKTFYSILKVIAQKRGALSKILTKLDGALYFQKKFYFAKWKILARTAGYLDGKGTSKLQSKTVKFEDNNASNDNAHANTNASIRDQFLGESPKTSRMDQINTFTKLFDSKYGDELGHYSHRNHIFRKCPACDSFPYLT